MSRAGLQLEKHSVGWGEITSVSFERPTRELLHTADRYESDPKLHLRFVTAAGTSHEERFAEVLQACADAPRSAADLLPVMFKRELDMHQTTFALGEAVAHVHALAAENKLAAISGSDGVLRFATVR